MDNRLRLTATARYGGLGRWTRQTRRRVMGHGSRVTEDKAMTIDNVSFLRFFVYLDP